MQHDIGKIHTLLFLLWAACAYGEPMTLESHRFSYHSAANYERLVLEFKGGDVGLAVTQNSSGGLTRNLIVNKAALQGALPEAKINQSFQGQAKYLENIALNPFFPPNGFSVSTDLKKDEVQVDAFWLTAPSRLVIDVFPAGSPRALGLAHLSKMKKPAQRARTGKKVAKRTKAKPASHAQKRTPASPREKMKEQLLARYLCFPFSSQVGLTVNFAKKGSGSQAGEFPVELQRNPGSAVARDDSVVCYPRRSQVVPRFSFSQVEKPKTVIPGTEAVKRAKALAPPQLPPKRIPSQSPETLQPPRQ